MRAAELCAGYGGLQMAVEEVFGASLAWVSEHDAAPSRILAHHWPHVPNHGDMTRIDWAAVEPVDIISGGTPCTDLSMAGKRAGMSEGTRSNLWVQMREAIAVIRPRYVVWENVRGAYSAAADSDVEPCPGCVGDEPGVFLRALGRVLGDLTELGYDSAWHGLTAASVGAPHGRFRVFVLAWTPADAEREHGQRRPNPVSRSAGERHPSGPPERPTAAAPPDADRLGYERNGRARNGRAGPENGSGAPADTTRDGRDEGWPEPARLIGGLDATERRYVDWDVYEPAIRRWERVLGRLAPSPTEATRKGSQRLSPRFVEWMQGLPAGHVTDPVIGLTRNEQLKALGNGVVPQQATAALRYLLAATESERAA